MALLVGDGTPWGGYEGLVFLDLKDGVALMAVISKGGVRYVLPAAFIAPPKNDFVWWAADGEVATC